MKNNSITQYLKRHLVVNLHYVTCHAEFMECLLCDILM